MWRDLDSLDDVPAVYPHRESRMPLYIGVSLFAFLLVGVAANWMMAHVA
ncbi:hypothetical protein Q8W67_08915 [Methylobacterium sp. NEAU K]|nr:hypothetical protein [Methylobacterium sp. NEAU K]